MGSFNVVCSISGISLSPGTEIVYIPLETSMYPYSLYDGNNSLIGLNCFYSPVTLPIFGIYDDYGSIDCQNNKDENTKLIEDFFKMDIKKIIDIEEQPKPICSGMFIHKEIYDTMIKFNLDEFGNKCKTDEFYHREYLKNELDKFILEKNEKLNLSIRLGLEQSFLTDMISNIFNFKHNKTFREIYIPNIEENIIQEQLIDFVIMEAFMYASNKIYFPSMSGYQFGHHYATRRLAGKTFTVIDKLIKEEENYRADDYNNDDNGIEKD